MSRQLGAVIVVALLAHVATADAAPPTRGATATGDTATADDATISRTTADTTAGDTATATAGDTATATGDTTAGDTATADATMSRAADDATAGETATSTADTTAGDTATADDATISRAAADTTAGDTATATADTTADDTATATTDTADGASDMATATADTTAGNTTTGDTATADGASDTSAPGAALVATPSEAYELPSQSIGAAIGIATGGRTTAGGFRVRGHYTYQMSRSDWFDGTASFTFGGGGAACFRDRANDTICDHGYLDGASAEIAAGVRRYFAAQGRLQPFARLSIGVAVVRFGDDDVTGLAIPVHVGAGVRARISADVAVLVLSEAMFGVARFGGLGAEPQAGIAITAGAELRLP